jgi:heat shock protein HslJ
MRLWMMLFARHARSCRGHPRLKLRAEPKTWMAETINPAMTWIGHRSFRRLLGCIVAATMATTAAAAEFPFERELLLEAKPLPGSKRVPMLEILREGRALIDLWCKSGDGRVEVSGGTIKITIEAMKVESCTPERMARDEPLAAALAAITQWRMEDDVLVLIGPTELRYTLSSH